MTTSGKSPVYCPSSDRHTANGALGVAVRPALTDWAPVREPADRHSPPPPRLPHLTGGGIQTQRGRNSAPLPPPHRLGQFPVRGCRLRRCKSSLEAPLRGVTLALVVTELGGGGGGRGGRAATVRCRTGALSDRTFHYIRRPRRTGAPTSEWWPQQMVAEDGPVSSARFAALCSAPRVGSEDVRSQQGADVWCPLP